jgi:transposase
LLKAPALGRAAAGCASSASPEDARAAFVIRTIGADRVIGVFPRRLRAMPGIGPISAFAIETFTPPMKQFKRGRDFAAWLGLVTQQIWTGGKKRLGLISKMR